MWPFVQNLYGNAGLVPLMIVASVPLYNIFSVLVLTVTAPDAQQADHRGLVAAARHHHQPDHTGYFRGSAVLATGNRLSADAGQGFVNAGQLRNAYGAAEYRRGF